MSNIPAFGYAREDDSVEDLCPLFLSVNAEHLINDVANGLSMSDDELKAFIYNMYYDPVVCFIYDVWGRYLYVAPPQEDTTDDGRRIQGALPVHPVTPPIQPVGAALNN
jgi:hypothetical protein